MRIAATGATGFVGSHLIDRLLADGHELTALVRDRDDADRLRQMGISIVVGRVTDSDAVMRTVDGSAVVFSLARAKSHGTSAHSEVIAVNVNGARNVARAAALTGARVVHASSAAVYGSRIERIPSAEDVIAAPDSAYARSKLRGEETVRGAADDHVIARISAVLGPRCSSWLPLFRSAMHGSLRLAGDGTNLHHPVDVSDVVAALVSCAATTAARGRTYNIAGPNTVTVGRMIELMSSACNGVTTMPRPVPRFAADMYLAAGRAADRLLRLRLPRLESVRFLTANRAFDISRAKNDLAFTPETGVEESISRTAEWYRLQGWLES